VARPRRPHVSSEDFCSLTSGTTSSSMTPMSSEHFGFLTLARPCRPHVLGTFWSLDVLAARAHRPLGVGPQSTGYSLTSSSVDPWPEDLPTALDPAFHLIFSLVAHRASHFLPQAALMRGSECCRRLTLSAFNSLRRRPRPGHPRPGCDHEQLAQTAVEHPLRLVHCSHDVAPLVLT